MMSKPATLRAEIDAERVRHTVTLARVDRLVDKLQEVHFGEPVAREMTAVERALTRKKDEDSER